MRPLIGAWMLALLALPLGHWSGAFEWFDERCLALASAVTAPRVQAQNVAIVSISPQRYFADQAAASDLRQRLQAVGVKRVIRFAERPRETGESAAFWPDRSDPRLPQTIPQLDGEVLLQSGAPKLLSGRSVLLVPDWGKAMRAEAVDAARRLEEAERSVRIQAWPASLSWTYLAGVLLLAGLAAMRLPSRSLPVVLPLLLPLEWALGLGSLLLFDRWPPLGWGLALATVTLLGMDVSRQRQRARGLRRLLQDLRSMLHRRLIPVPVQQQVDHWAALQQFVVQALTLERSIFLDRIDGDHRVQEVKAYRCSIADIHEMRRDFERPPYAQAIRLRRPVKMQQPFLANVPADCDEFLAPLVFGADVLGFWVFTVPHAELQRQPELPALAGEFAVQLGEQLFQRSEYQRQHQRRERTYSFLRRDRRREDLSAYAQLMQRRLALFESNLREVPGGLALYDCFGRPLHLNALFEKVMVAQGVTAWECSVTDAIAALCGDSPSDARRELQRVVFDHARPERDIEIDFGGGHERFQLSISALQADEMQSAEYPFGTLGFQIHLARSSGRSQASAEALRIIDALSELVEEARSTGSVSPLDGVQAPDLQASLWRLRGRSGAAARFGFDPVHAVSAALRENQKLIASRGLQVRWQSAQLGRAPIKVDDGTDIVEALFALIFAEAPVDSVVTIAASQADPDSTIDLLVSVPAVIWTASQWDELSAEDGGRDRRFTRLMTGLQRFDANVVRLSYHSHPSAGTLLRLQFASESAAKDSGLGA